MWFYDFSLGIRFLRAHSSKRKRTRFVDTNKGAAVEHNNNYYLPLNGSECDESSGTTTIYAFVGMNFFRFPYGRQWKKRTERTSAYGGVCDSERNFDVSL